jgi:hypothetical protein
MAKKRGRPLGPQGAIDNKRLLETLAGPNPLQCSDPGCKRCQMYEAQRQLADQWLQEERYGEGKDMPLNFMRAATDEWVRLGLLVIPEPDGPAE